MYILSSMKAGVVQQIKRSAGTTFRAGEAIAAGVHWRDLYELRDTGQIIELSRGLFRFADAEILSELDLLAVWRRAPHGVICLTSALAHWELTDEIPRHVHLAVPRGTSRPIIRHPPTRVHVFDPDTFALGRRTVELAPGESIRITDPERTIVDMFRFRGRLGTSLATAALRTYLQGEDPKPGRVAELARALRVAGPVHNAIEILQS